MNKQIHNVRNAYSDIPNNGTRNEPYGKNGAQQHFGPEVNINTIMEKAKRGIAPRVGNKIAKYGDFSNVTCFADALQQINEANEMFMSIPAKVRARFNNDPNYLIQFMNHPGNRAEAIELGLIDPPDEKVLRVGEPQPTNGGNAQ